MCNQQDDIICDHQPLQADNLRAQHKNMQLAGIHLWSEWPHPRLQRPLPRVRLAMAWEHMPETLLNSTHSLKARLYS